MLEQLFLAFEGRGHRFVRFEDYYQDRETYDHLKDVVLFRHDVDRSPRSALATAETEAKHGIFGTYYFRVKPWTFKPPILEAIASLGHEIGYHYEVLPDSAGDFAKAAELCRKNLARLREVVPVTTASMHSRPLSRWDGRLFWDKYSFEEFGLLGEAYRSVDHYRYTYLADSGRSWNADRNVIWDSVEGSEPPRIERGTEGLVAAIRHGQISNVQLLIHPNRWPASSSQWVVQSFKDAAINNMKKVVRFWRRRRPDE